MAKRRKNAAAIELGEYGITVNAIASTVVRTGLGGSQTKQQRAESNEWLQIIITIFP